MQYLLGCFGVLILIALIIALVQWIFGNIVAIIGIALAIWGFREWKKNRELNAKSKVPAILILLGLSITIGWFALKPAPPVEVAEESHEESSTTKEEESTETAQTVADPAKSEKETDSKLLTAKVLSVTDGDTLKVDLDGKEETVRLILVDTPETKHPQLGVQPIGKEASEFTTEQLSGKTVKLVPGVEERDRYGRLLAYLYVDDKMFNKLLVEKGLARVAVYPPNTEHLEELETAQATAKEKGIGIWEIENYATEDGYDPSVYEPEPEPEPTVVEEPEPEPETIVEEPVTEDPATEAVFYKNCTAAREAGAAPIHSGEPGYASHLDRDGDGIGCDK